MASFKGMDVHIPAVEAARGSEESVAMSTLGEFDPFTEGGIVILNDGGVAEIKHPSWVVEGGSLEPQDRITILPIQSETTGECRSFRWTGGELWDPILPTLGNESELEVRHNGEPHEATIDGTQLLYPGGESESFHDANLDPEAFKRTVEFGTDVAHGWDAYSATFIKRAVEVERWLEKNGLESPYLTGLIDTATKEGVTEHPWVSLMGKRMRSITEFDCLSMQLHVQLQSPEAGIHALTKYQGVQALFGLLTAAAPVRDGSFDTTLREHYHEQHTAISGETVLPSDDLLRHNGNMDAVPYDWRELARVLGSQSAGAFTEVIPPNLGEFLQAADQKMRHGDTVSTVRTFGWHSDRLRIDQGTVELCNLGTSGGNLHKSLAVQELAARYMVALQEEYRSQANAANWQREYEQAVEIGQANNYFAGLSGKATKLISMQGGMVAPSEVLASIRDFIAEHSPEPLSATAYAELAATLRPTPRPDVFANEEAVFDYFFQPGSTMTATEALRVAHTVSPGQSTGNLLKAYAMARRQHLYEQVRQRGQEGAM